MFSLSYTISPSDGCLYLNSNIEQVVVSQNPALDSSRKTDAVSDVIVYSDFSICEIQPDN